MLSKRLFKEALEEIKEVFDGFNLTESKIKIWYKYSKYLTDSQWKKKIENCIKYCRKIPTLADILDLSGYYKNDEGWARIPVFEVDDYDYKPIPEKIKEQIHRVLNITDRDKLNKLKEEK